METLDLAAARTKALFGIFGVDAALNDVAVREDAVLRARETRAGGDADLPLHDVQTRHHLGDAVLHLQARVHLHKVEIVIVIKQKFHGTGVDVVYRLCRLDRCHHHPLARFFVQRRTRTLLDHLLVLALHAAFALAETDDVVVFVAEELHFDMLDGMNEFFYVAGAVAKRRLCLGTRGQKRLFKLLRHIYAANALAAAAGTRLDEQRKTDFFRFLLGCRQVLHHVAAGRDRHACRAHGLACHVLVAEHGNHVGAGTDKIDIALLAERYEFGVLAQQTVARVDRLRTALDRNGENGRDIEIAVRHAVAADAIALVRQLHVHGVLVRLGIDGDGGNAHLAAGADDANGDLAAVGNQNF